MVDLAQFIPVFEEEGYMVQRFATDTVHFGLVHKFEVHCPCGGVETLRIATSGEDTEDWLALDIRRALQSHTKEDKERGALAPDWVPPSRRDTAFIATRSI